MISVVTVKMFAMRGSIPATNWWWAQTRNERIPVAIAVFTTVM